MSTGEFQAAARFVSLPVERGAAHRRSDAGASRCAKQSALAVLAVASMSGHLVPAPDKGAFAHIWQLLMAGQLPILAFFAIKWLPRPPKQTLYVLALQAGAVLAAMAPVYFLHL